MSRDSTDVVVSGQQVTIEQIWRLQAEMAKLPQAEIATDHLHADGLYCRAISQPAGCLIVGKVHKREHFFFLASGTLRVTTDSGVVDLTGPRIVVSRAGTKRAGLALTDVICFTVHRTDETELEAIEMDLIEPDATALFDAYNKPLLIED